MEKENLSIVLKAIEDKEKRENTKIYTLYEDLYAKLEEINDTAFNDLLTGILTVFPFGDYISNTGYENSQIEFYIIYKTDRENINLAVTSQKVTKKGKVKVSTYQQIMGGATNKGIMQAEQVAERFDAYLRAQMPSIAKIYTKRNQIMIRFAQNVVAKITICYDFGNEDFLCRRVNTWVNVNPTKYLDNIDKKNEQTKQNFGKVVKLFKALELELLLAEETELYIGKNGFVENYLYNIPNNLFLENNNYVMIQNIITYMLNKKPNNFMLADETDLMFNDKSLYSIKLAKQFVNKIRYAFENFEQIIDKKS